MTETPVAPPLAIFDTLTDLVACWTEQITKDGLPQPCFLGVIPGDAAVASYGAGDDCGDLCGMGWVRMVTAYPASGLGEPNDREGNCSSGIGWTLEMGMLRCVDVGDDMGNPPPAGEQERSARLQIEDMITMRRAVYCCDAIPNRDVSLGAYTPAGPMGGLVGGTWNLTLWTP